MFHGIVVAHAVVVGVAIKLGEVDIFAGVLVENFTVDDVDLTVALVGEVLIVRDDNQRDALLLVEAEKQVLDAFASSGIEVTGRLVGEDDFWIIDDGASDTDALFLAAGKVVSLVFGLVGELNDFERLEGAAATFAETDAIDFERQNDVVEHGIVGVHKEALEDEAELFVAELVELTSMQFAGVFAVKFDGAFGRLVEKRQEMHQGGLAGAGFADNRDGFALVDVDIDAF